MRLLMSVVFLSLALEVSARAEEAKYCDPDTFATEHEIPVTTPGLVRARAFRLGSVKLVGLAVGNSEASAVRALSEELGTPTPERKHCIWYLNKGNAEAEAEFNWNYVSNPTFLEKNRAKKKYLKTVGPAIDENAVNMIDCARDVGYVAMGCNGQKHRGPTVFGMLLAYSGCSPRRANAIVNRLWGLNGVPNATRELIIRGAYERGKDNPARSQELRELFSR